MYHKLLYTYKYGVYPARSWWACLESQQHWAYLCSCSDEFSELFSTMATLLERMTAYEVGEWLKEHGFSDDIVDGQ